MIFRAANATAKPTRKVTDMNLVIREVCTVVALAAWAPGLAVAAGAGSGEAIVPVAVAASSTQTASKAPGDLGIPVNWQTGQDGYWLKLANVEPSPIEPSR